MLVNHEERLVPRSDASEVESSNEYQATIAIPEGQDDREVEFAHEDSATSEEEFLLVPLQPIKPGATMSWNAGIKRTALRTTLGNDQTVRSSIIATNQLPTQGESLLSAESAHTEVKHLIMAENSCNLDSILTIETETRQASEKAQSSPNTTELQSRITPSIRSSSGEVVINIEELESGEIMENQPEGQIIEDNLLWTQHRSNESGQISDSENELPERMMAKYASEAQEERTEDEESVLKASDEVRGGDGTNDEQEDGKNEEHEDGTNDELQTGQSCNPEDDEPKDDENCELENRQEGPTKARGDSSPVSTRAPQVLNDLDHDALQLQIRYFHVGRAIGAISLKEPVHCLICAKAGHMDETCDAEWCSDSGTKGPRDRIYEDHFPLACPVKVFCQKCYKQGHQIEDCKQKLRAAPGEVPPLCERCNGTDHFAKDCDLIWRTSGQLWEKELPLLTVRLFCYECGHAGHLGNDCPTRKPRKRMASSTWSTFAPHNRLAQAQISPGASRNPNLPPKPSRDVGRMDCSSDEDDVAAFHRPPILPAKPAGPFQLQMPSFTFSGTSWTPINATSSRPREPISQTAQAYAPQRGPMSRRQSNLHADSSNHRGPRERDRSRSRSRSPKRYSRGRGRGSQPKGRDRGEHGRDERERDEYRPPKKTSGTYKPMPSAGRGAWKKHRI